MAKAQLKPQDTDKWERVRRLRNGDFLRLFRNRYHSRGFLHFPDDEAGRDDLWLLVTNVSLAAAEPKKKMRHVIELWAPWMAADELERYVEHVWGLDFYQRLMTARDIGERLGLTNAERERLKLWQFKPIDMTDDELAAHRKRKNNERRRARRGRTRAEYLASCLSATKPWAAEGISRRTWQRRRGASVVAQETARVQTRGRNNSVYAESILATALMGDRPKGLHEGGEPEGRATSNEGREVVSHAPCSSAQRPRDAPPKHELARVAAEMRERAKQGWLKRDSKKIAPTFKKRANPK